MAFKLADINIGSAIADNWGRSTSYFQRYLQATNRQVSIAIGGLSQVVEDLQAQLVLILEQQALTSDLIDYANQSVFYLSGDAGVVAATPNGSGDVAIFHNFGTDPGTLGSCRAFPTGTSAFHVQMLSVDADYLNIRLFDMAGAPITSGTWDVAWQITVYPIPPFVPPP